MKLSVTPVSCYYFVTSKCHSLIIVHGGSVRIALLAPPYNSAIMNSVLPGFPIINAHSLPHSLFHPLCFRYSRSLQQFVNVSPKRQAVLLLYRKVRRLLRAWVRVISATSSASSGRKSRRSYLNLVADVGARIFHRQKKLDVGNFCRVATFTKYEFFVGIIYLGIYSCEFRESSSDIWYY